MPDVPPLHNDWLKRTRHYTADSLSCTCIHDGSIPAYRTRCRVAGSTWVFFRAPMSDLHENPARLGWHLHRAKKVGKRRIPRGEPIRVFTLDEGRCELDAKRERYEKRGGVPSDE